MKKIIFLFTLIISSICFLSSTLSAETPKECKSSANCAPGEWREYGCRSTYCGGTEWGMTCMYCPDK